MDFMDENFLLPTEAARKLYRDYADMRRIPIVDYHCHMDPREIYEDRQFETLTQVWLGGDHYKWRQLRTCGVKEEEITGDSPDFVKFQNWARIMPLLIGNPLYHWSHMELRYYFHYNGILNETTAKEVWEHCNSLLKKPEYSARNLIRMSNVRLLCTTDDPADSLIWHRKLKEDASFEVSVLPTFRPDSVLHMEKDDFPAYMKRLSQASGIEICDLSTLYEALKNRLDYFLAHGCVLSDHSLDFVPCRPAKEEKIEEIFVRRLKGENVSREEILNYQTACLLFLAKEYHRRGVVMQLHFGCKRNNNLAAYRRLGPDTGFDSIGGQAPLQELADFFGLLSLTDQIPKTILYSLNPGDDAAIDSIIGCFQGEWEERGEREERSKRGEKAEKAGRRGVALIQHGSAWWFNDHYDGMRNQLKSLASQSALGTFIGMLTDSRSFLSYTRHDYFRRVLCGLLGEWVSSGAYPEDYETLGKLVEGICYDNAIEYFGFDLEKD